jgi:flavodoxin
MSKVLVVQYSRTGNTRRLAEAIVAATGWELETIVDTRDRSGVLGFLRSGLEAMLRRKSRLRPAQKDPREYDLVVIGSPVWDRSVSVPVRTWVIRAVSAAVARRACACTW